MYDPKHGPHFQRTTPEIIDEYGSTLYYCTWCNGTPFGWGSTLWHLDTCPVYSIREYQLAFDL